MRLLLDIGHPAHVHLFRNLADRAVGSGGQVLAATRDKDVTVSLCRAYGIHQDILSSAYSGHVLAGILELVMRTSKLMKLTHCFRPDALLGTSLSIGIIGKCFNIPSFVLNEDDASVVPLFARIAYPLSTFIVTPGCLRHEGYGKKHLTYPGFHELAYLHPGLFAPDPEVPRSLGIDPSEPFFILRFVSLKAHHDTRATGLPYEAARELVRMLSRKGRVLITSEGALHEEFRPYQFPLRPELFQDVLAYASLCIGDSQTVTAEAAVLGVPNLRCNSFVGRISYLEELEKVHNLTRGFLPDQAGRLIETARAWLEDLDDIKRTFQHNRAVMLEQCVNLTEWLWDMLHERLG